MIIIDERSGYGKEKCDDPFVSLLVHRVDVDHKKKCKLQAVCRITTQVNSDYTE